MEKVMFGKDSGRGKHPNSQKNLELEPLSRPGKKRINFTILPRTHEWLAKEYYVWVRPIPTQEKHGKVVMKM
ncbi:hypothetical protein NIES2101_13485 [Calothrix sp. HK-06]|nr:hypothetical protein NIES2101_13485 [Calothrix sp. HK-06]